MVSCLAHRLGARLQRRRRRNYALARAWLEGTPLTLVQPLTFMNDSGAAVKPVLAESNAEIANLVVVCDTMDLDPGASRLRLSGSSAGNKGLASILGVLGTDQVKRIYLGVGRPPPGVPVTAHVLGRPRGETAAAIERAVAHVCANVELLIDGNYEGDYQRAMNVINQRGGLP